MVKIVLEESRGKEPLSLFFDITIRLTMCVQEKIELSSMSHRPRLNSNKTSVDLSLVIAKSNSKKFKTNSRGGKKLGSYGTGGSCHPMQPTWLRACFRNLATYILFINWVTQQKYQLFADFSQKNWKYNKRGTLIRAGGWKIFRKNKFEDANSGPKGSVPS